VATMVASTATMNIVNIMATRTSGRRVARLGVVRLLNDETRPLSKRALIDPRRLAVI
jgi:hypothetical protein